MSIISSDLSRILGRGSWNNWNYDVSVLDMETGVNLTLHTERNTSVMVRQLAPSRVYRFRVWAFSSAGHGPPSDSFIGQTLALGNLQLASLVAGYVCLKLQTCSKILYFGGEYEYINFRSGRCKRLNWCI